MLRSPRRFLPSPVHVPWPDPPTRRGNPRLSPRFAPCLRPRDLTFVRSSSLLVFSWMGPGAELETPGVSRSCRPPRRDPSRLAPGRDRHFRERLNRVVGNPHVSPGAQGSGRQSLTIEEGVFMRIALSLRKLGLTSDVLHGLAFGSMAAAISLWGRSASVGDWREKHARKGSQSS